MKAAFAAFFILLTVICDPAQRPVRKILVSSKKAKVVSETKPTVYITFLRRERVEPERKDDGDYLFFRLTNNSSWPIRLDMFGSEPKFGDVGLYYSIENTKTGENRIGSLYCHHVCSVNSLGAGKSLIFSIAVEEACNDATMKIRFEFAWENELSYLEGTDTTHIVNFYFNSIPRSVLPLMKDADKKYFYQKNRCYS